jgi:hypothetical protein
VSTLESRHCCGAVCQEIVDFSLAFVTPLGADDDDVFSHDGLFRFRGRSAAHDEQQHEAGYHDDQADRPQVIVT